MRGKTVVITGGTSGIGEVAAELLAKKGARFVLVARDCMSSEHFGQLAWQFKRMSGSSGLKVQAAMAC